MCCWSGCPGCFWAQVLPLGELEAHEVDTWMPAYRSDLPTELNGVIWLQGNEPSVFTSLFTGQWSPDRRKLVMDTYGPSAWAMEEAGIKNHYSQRRICTCCASNPSTGQS